MIGYIQYGTYCYNCLVSFFFYFEFQSIMIVYTNRKAIFAISYPCICHLHKVHADSLCHIQ